MFVCLFVCLFVRYAVRARHPPTGTVGWQAVSISAMCTQYLLLPMHPGELQAPPQSRSLSLSLFAVTFAFDVLLPLAAVAWPIRALLRTASESPGEAARGDVVAALASLDARTALLGLGTVVVSVCEMQCGFLASLCVSLAPAGGPSGLLSLGRCL